MLRGAPAGWEAVIGLEVHAQLDTRTKLFCGCETRFGAPPNTLTCPVCLGLPGALPVLGGQAVALAVCAALALGCRVHPRSRFARKHYFYPDLAKGYQITQDAEPIATGGALELPAEGAGGPLRVRIARVHIEEDAGKNVHDVGASGPGAGRSWVDYNRAGTPLIEIVSEPDLRSSAAAAAYLKSLRQILRYVDVCDGNLEEGSLRCDANVSVRRAGDARLGTRVELKNINSFRFVAQAIDFEIARQIELVEGGGRVTLETRQWDAQARATRPLREKEEAHDYRYFPEPDLPDLELDAAFVAARRAALPELPAAKVARLMAAGGLSAYDARLLCEDIQLARYFEAAVAAAGGRAKQVANWVINELLRVLKDAPLASMPLTPAHLGELVILVEEGVISGKMAKTLFEELARLGGSPRRLVAARGLAQASGEAALMPWVEQVVAEHPDEVAKFRAGSRRVLGFLVGQVMKKSRGQANPGEVNRLLTRALDAGRAAPP